MWWKKKHQSSKFLNYFSVEKSKEVMGRNSSGIAFNGPAIGVLIIGGNTWLLVRKNLIEKWEKRN